MGSLGLGPAQQGRVSWKPAQNPFGNVQSDFQAWDQPILSLTPLPSQGPVVSEQELPQTRSSGLQLGARDPETPWAQEKGVTSFEMAGHLGPLSTGLLTLPVT